MREGKIFKSFLNRTALEKSLLKINAICNSNIIYLGHGGHSRAARLEDHVRISVLSTMDDKSIPVVSDH